MYLLYLLCVSRVSFHIFAKVKIDACPGIKEAPPPPMLYTPPPNNYFLMDFNISFFISQSRKFV